MMETRPTAQVITDAMDPARATALNAALGRAGTLEPGMDLPPFYHQLYFWQASPPGELGRDGHPRVGGLIPETGLPRRMWAGGRLVFEAPLRAGIPAERLSLAESLRHKTGRSGPLAFVTLRHEIRQQGRLCVTEWQDLVYRADPAPGSPPPAVVAAPRDETDRRTEHFDTTLLFRYSALTFNGHRIHYDETYARRVEGYDGLVVHGPLLAQMLMLMAVDLMGPLAGFAFRGSAPLVHTEAAEFCRTGTSLWVRGPDGRQIMSAEAVPA